jgi:hypothetical protein
VQRWIGYNLVIHGGREKCREMHGSVQGRKDYRGATELTKYRGVKVRRTLATAFCWEIFYA